MHVLLLGRVMRLLVRPWRRSLWWVLPLLWWVLPLLWWVLSLLWWVLSLLWRVLPLLWRVIPLLRWILWDGEQGGRVVVVLCQCVECQCVRV
jgi:hypothetical protein